MQLHLLSPSGFINRNVDNCPAGGDGCDFLWFGSAGAIHKGLDILLDTFKNVPKGELYIAGLCKDEVWLLDEYSEN